MSTPTVSRNSRVYRAQGRVRGTGVPRGNSIAPPKKNAHLPRASASSSPKPLPVQSSDNAPNNARVERKTWTKGTTTPNNNRSSPSPSENGRQSIARKHAATPNPPRDSQFLNASSQDRTRRDPGSVATGVYQKHMGEIFTKLKRDREKERRNAIKDGFLADPDRPTSLANAITPVGTCQHMCPDFERVERIVQLMVDGCEKSMSQANDKIPDEKKMVKRFRRSAAGYDEQLPSDIRPPEILQKTLTYLINEVVGGSQPLGLVHKFIWDRTRSIRNDFSIQQVTKPDDLRIAIDCFERIARFHILSLHLLSRPGKDNTEFDSHQEREQLNNTLLSLMYYYDDSRSKIALPNEAEFRAYCIIFEIQDQRTDLEDRAQSWPRHLLSDERVKTALRLYAAAGNTRHEQGPLRPRAPFVIAQALSGRFWAILRSNAVSYLMACVAEIYFNTIRKNTLEEIWKAYKAKRYGPMRVEDWVLGDLITTLGFDSEDQAQSFIEAHGFSIEERDDGESFVDLASVTGRDLNDTNPHRKQLFSEYLVEDKRYHRTLPAIIDGLSASQAKIEGAVEQHFDIETLHHGPEPSLFITSSSEDEQDYSHGNKSSDNGVNLFPSQQAIPGRTSPSAEIVQRDHNLFTVRPEADVSKSSVFNPTIDHHARNTTSETDKPSTTSALSATATDFQVSTDIPGSLINARQLDHDLGLADPLSPESKPKANGNTPLELFKNTSKSSSNSWRLTDSSFAPKHDDIKYVNGYQRINLPSVHPETSNTANDTSCRVLPSSSIPPHSATTTGSSGQVKPFSLGESGLTYVPASQPIGPARQLAESPDPNQVNTIHPSISHSAPILTSPLDISKNIPKSTQPPPSPKNVPSLQTSLVAAEQYTSNNSPTVTDVFTTSSAAQAPLEGRASLLRQKNVVSLASQKQAVLGKIAVALTHDNGGLLQQFLEYYLGKIITGSMQQVKDEKSWIIATNVRNILLARKYSRIWKQCIWNQILLRKGRERRKMLARSMQELDRHSRQRRQLPSSMIEQIHNHGRSIDAPRVVLNPHQTKHDRSGQSLPDSISHNNHNPASGQKRKRIVAEDRWRGVVQENQTPHHKRSHTAGSNPTATIRDQVMQSSQLSRRRGHLPSPSRSTDQAMHSVRNIVTAGRTDTTRTDYFKLKALGIDPDTPVKPRVFNSQDPSGSSTSFEKEPSKSPRSSRKEDTPRQVQDRLGLPSALGTSKIKLGGDSDEELFAQMRQVKEAMVESISWFRAERSKSGLDVRRNANGHVRGTISNHSPSHIVKPTLSRTMHRICATGAQGLWPPKAKAQKVSDQQESHPHELGHLSTKPSRTSIWVDESHPKPYTSLSASHTSTINTLNNQFNPLNTSKHYSNYAVVDGPRRRRHSLSRENRSQYSELGMMEAAEDAAYVDDMPNGTKFQYSDAEDDDQCSLRDYQSTGDDQELLESEEAEEDEEDEDHSRNGEDYSGDGQHSDAPSAIRKPDGQLKGTTIEDAIEL